MVIGFIGLGNMGTPMVKNVVQGGFSVRAFNRSAEKRQSAQDQGVPVVDTLAAAVKDADVVITMLSDDAAVTKVQQEVLPLMKKGSIHVSMSTIAPATAQLLADACQSRDIAYLAAPVMGRPPAAAAKQLSILVSGQQEAKEKVKPVLQSMGQRVFDFGDNVTSATTVKLMMNYQIFVIVEMLSEVMLAAEKSGVDKSVLLDTMTSTIFGAPVFNIYGPLVIQEKDNPNGFSTTLASKDLRLMQETAVAQNLRLPLAEVIQRHFREIIEQQHGHRDVAQLLTHLRNELK